MIERRRVDIGASSPLKIRFSLKKNGFKNLSIKSFLYYDRHSIITFRAV
jgi:hypothetical protein